MNGEEAPARGRLNWPYENDERSSRMRRHSLASLGLPVVLAVIAAPVLAWVSAAPAAQAPPAAPPPAFTLPSQEGGAPMTEAGSPSIPEGGSPTAPEGGAPEATDASPPPPPLADSGTTPPSPEAGVPVVVTDELPPMPLPEATAAPLKPLAVPSPPLDFKRVYVAIPVSMMLSASINLAAGIGFTVLSNAKSAKTSGVFRELRQDGGPGACSGETFRLRCDELYEADGDRQTYRNMAVLSFVGAFGFAAGAGVSYFIISRPTEGKPTGRAPARGRASALVIDVDIAPGGGGAAIKGTF
jgi:hypothetical protein